VDRQLDGSSKLITVDEQSDDDIMQPDRLGEANCFASKSFNSSASGEMLALNRLSIGFTHSVNRRMKQPVISTPIIPVELGDANRC
jgi:hypothetical protein